jgi:NhaP-type Na+/H+ or K+/H+ antiporter
MEWSLALIAATLLGYAAVSRLLRGSVISAAMVFTAVGLLFGPKVLDLVTASPTGESVRLLAEAALTLVLFGDASRLDLHRLRHQLALPARLLGIGLPLTIALGALLAALVFGSFTAAEAVVLAVLLAPTDAALGQAVVTEPRLPSRIRQGQNVESGLNDGICVPILLIALAAAEAESGLTSDAHAVRIVVEQIGYGMLAGVGAGIAAATVLRLAGGHGLIERSWLQVVPFAGAALAYGLATPAGGSGFIAAFVAGLVFARLRRADEAETSYLVDQAGGILSAVAFLAFGAVFLGPALASATWAAFGYAVLSLTVVRMLPVAIAMAGMHARRQTVALVGWFGPRGLASIVFGVIVIEESHLPHVSTILLCTYLTVGLSVLAHGVSAAPLTARYVRWYEAHPRDRRPGMESVPVKHVRHRGPTVSGVHPNEVRSRSRPRTSVVETLGEET